jgi:hypothetical protein
MRKVARKSTAQPRKNTCLTTRAAVGFVTFHTTGSPRCS